MMFWATLPAIVAMPAERAFQCLPCQRVATVKLT